MRDNDDGIAQVLLNVTGPANSYVTGSVPYREYPTDARPPINGT
jgi:hypothetical protein